MKIVKYDFYNENTKTEIKLNDYLRKRFEKTESVLKHFSKFNRNRLNEYISAFQKRLSNEIEDFSFNIDLVDQQNIKTDLEILNKYSELEDTLILFICKLLKIPEELETIEEEIQLIYYNVRRTQGHLSYYRVKAMEDLLGKLEATKLYKKIVESQIRDEKALNTSEKPEDPFKVTRLKSREFILNHYKTLGIANFTLGIYDDFKEIYRFDKCLAHEVLKDLNDPDIAYLSSCFPRDLPCSNEGHVINMIRSQTLHHADFCDELYYNIYVHPDTELPSLEFTKNMGKEK